MLGISKNNKHSFIDFGITIKSKTIGMPPKNKIKDSVPFMNGSYDFSELYGSQTYDDRTLTYVFNVIGNSKTHMNTLKMQVTEWLISGSKSPLYDDSYPGYYFMAECEDSDFKESGNIGELTIKFTAQPFMISESNEGNNLWDTFNFELDVLQDNTFNINGSSSIKVYNKSITNSCPSVICSGQMEVTKKNITYKFNTGTTKDYRFEFSPGSNDLSIKGNGTIEFRFKSEVL